MMHRYWPIALLGAVACNNSTDVNYGLTQRTPVQGLAFPSSLPNPQPVQAVVAFPSLAFNDPLFLTAPPDGTDRIIVLEKGGTIHIFPNDPMTSTTTVFLDMTSMVLNAGEQGLLGFAFHPDYASNGYFYTYHSAATGNRRTVLSRWQVSGGDPNVANPGSQQILLEIDQPYTNHNGGALAFGPDDRLYIAVGDGGAANDPQGHGQNLTTLLGTVLRLEPDGSVPVDNPFVGGSAGERPEIWAYGIRNPWRMSFDRATGDLWLGDVGQNDREEVDIIVRGGNFGWPIYEGHRSNLNPGGIPASAFAAPVFDYDHGQGASITGGYVYRGTALPTYAGAYVYGDFVSGRIWALVWDGFQTISNTQIATIGALASFGEDEAGELYICSFNGFIYRLQETNPPPTPPPFPATLSATGLFSDLADLQPAPGVIEYDVNSPLWSDGASKRRWMALPGISRIAFDPTDAWVFPTGTVLVKHFEIDTAPGVTQRLETRILIYDGATWQGYTYRWNTAGTDADLLPGPASEILTITEVGGAQRQQTWYYPDRADCTTCHTAAAGQVLGLRTRQLNRNFAYPAMVDNQLRAWNFIGLFANSIGDHAQYEALADPSDASQPIADRARSYLAANCSNCHQPSGPTPVDLDLRYGIAAGQMNAIGVTASTPAGGSGSAVRITAGQKEQSDLWERMRRRDAWGMPPLGSSELHQAAIDLIGQWIDSGAN